MQPPLFSTLVSRHLDAIAQALRGGHTHPGGPVPQASGARSSLAATRRVTLPRAPVTVLTERNLFVADKASPAACYHVFHADDAARPFTFGVTLTLGKDDVAFVKAAYAAVLGRPADQSGLATYANLLRAGVLKPGDLIRSLASSDEARERPGAVLIVPDTSGWLSQLSADPKGLAIVLEAKA